MKIGQYIDEKFSKDIYGSRLIRSRPTDTSSCEYDLSNQKFNIDSPRIYEQYQYKYQIGGIIVLKVLENCIKHHL